MSELSQEACDACRADAPRVSDSEQTVLLSALPEWQIDQSNGPDKLKRRFSFPNFVTAMAFADRVAELAEANNHHPLLQVEWGAATVYWWTHKIKGLHRNDFIMAAKTDELL